MRDLKDVKDWLQLAATPSVRRRSVGVALVVGSILLAINHGEAILHGDFSAGRLLRMALTVIVPYLVSTVSSVNAIRQLRRAAAASAEQAAHPSSSIRSLNRMAS
jgi:hypothetical protein